MIYPLRGWVKELTSHVLDTAEAVTLAYSQYPFSDYCATRIFVVHLPSWIHGEHATLALHASLILGYNDPSRTPHIPSLRRRRPLAFPYIHK
jgi:hypothetical protein